MKVRNFASIVAIAWASSAAAQTVPQYESTASGPVNVDSQSDLEVKRLMQDGDDSGIIVVTAQRREQRLVDVPISVAVASSDDLQLAGPDSLENLTKITPGVYLQRNIYGLSPTVRGIGSTLPASGGEQIVAMYVDEIYYPTPYGNVFDLASIEAVELLKGPQGTLFGRNATGGALLLRTLDPGFERAGRFKASYERFDQVRSSAYLNVPLTDTVAFNGSVAYRHSDGYVRDVRTGNETNGGNSFTGRAKLLLKPSDSFSVVFTAAHSEMDDPAGSDFRALQPAPLVSLLSGGPIATGRFNSSFATDQFIKTEVQEYSARARLELEAGTLSSFTAFLNSELDALNDLTGSYLPFNVALQVRTKTFTQEVNFASSSSGPLSYVVGAYYFRNKPRVPVITQNGAPLFFSSSNDYSIAGYADGTYEFGDLSVIAGLRYTYEKRRSETGFGVTEATGPATRFQEDADKQWTPRLGLRYTVTDRANIYATYSRGFKSGKFDLSTPTGPGVTPETVDAFEIGFKSASRDISFNAAAFYYNYKGTQVNATVTGPGGAIFTQLFNVPKSTIYGTEADISIRLNDNFDLKTAVAYTHARYDEFPFAPSYVVDPTDPATLGGLLFSNISVDASGNNMVRAPEFTASGAISYHTPLGSGNELEITLAPYYSSRVYFSFDNGLSQDPYFTLDGAITLTLDEHVEISVFGRNLTDSDHQTNSGQNALSLENVTFAKPRVYGISLGFTY